VNALPFPYAGPLVPPELTAAVLRALRGRIRRERVVRQEFGLAPTSGAGPEDLAGSGFRIRTDQTYLIDVSGGRDEVWTALSSSARKSIRKTERDGVRIVPAARNSDILKRVVESAYGARGADSGYFFDPLPDLLDLSDADFRVNWTVAEQNGVELGSLIAVSWGDMAFLWLGGVLPEHRVTRANVSLYWQSIEWAIDQGVRTVDLVGVPDAGIGRFKSQFGGTLHSYPRLQWTLPGLQSAQGAAGVVLRTLRGRR
jgi:hypothetical protein